jgi:hypothetical protein
MAQEEGTVQYDATYYPQIQNRAVVYQENLPQQYSINASLVQPTVEHVVEQAQHVPPKANNTVRKGCCSAFALFSTQLLLLSQ